MFEFLFIDLDDTILDFHKAEEVAIRKTLSAFGVAPTEAVCTRYSQINDNHWKMLERQEITRQQVLVGRFAQLFSELGVAADTQACSLCYMENLGKGHYFLPGALEAVQSLSKKYKLYLASNGTTVVQQSRIASAGIADYFQNIFISQQMGANKPAAAYFESCFAQIPGFDPNRAMIVGDSLSSDIQGGKNAGISTCWVNPGHKLPKAGLVPDYEIESLPQLEALLETL